MYGIHKTQWSGFLSFPLHSIFHIPYQYIYFVRFCFWEKDEDRNGRKPLSVTNNVPTSGGTNIDWSKWKLKYEFFFSFSNSNQNPCCNLERLVSKLYKFCFFVLFCFFCYRIIVIVALTLLTSSQSILLVWSKRNGKYNYSITTSNFMVSVIIIVLLKKIQLMFQSVIYV